MSTGVTSEVLPETTLPSPDDGIDDSENNPELVWLWDWPISENGTAKCISNNQKFCVNLSFAGFRPEAMMIKSFDKIKHSSFSCTVGLCPTTAKDDGENAPTFCRLDIQTFPASNCMSVEAVRELYRNVIKKRRSFKRFRKIYRVPETVDLRTLRVNISDEGEVILEADHRPKDTRRKPLRGNLSELAE